MTPSGLKLFARVLLVLGGIGYMEPRILANPIMTAGVGPISARFLIGLASAVLGIYLIAKKAP